MKMSDIEMSYTGPIAGMARIKQEAYTVKNMVLG